MRTAPLNLTNPATLREHGEIKARRNRIKMGTVALIAGVATTLVLAKKGKLNPVEGGNKILEAIKKAVKGPADKVLNIITGSKVAVDMAEGLGKAKTKLAPITEKISTHTQEARCRFSSLAEDTKTAFKRASSKTGEIKEGILADIETAAANAEGTIKGFAQKESTKKAVGFIKDIPSRVGEFAGKVKESVKDLAKKANGKTATALFEKFYKKAQ